jgi:hypothetical protein
MISYQGESFIDNQISVKQLKIALQWIEWFIKEINQNSIVYIEPFEKGSFKFKVSIKNIVENSISGILSSIVVFYLFTHGESYKVDLTNATINWDINIININWDTKLFSKDILPILQNQELKKATKKIINPLWKIWDELVFSDKQNNLVSKITYDEKENFCKDYIKEQNQFRVRGWIYEINLKQKSFKVESSLWYSFNVNLADNIKIEDILNWLNTNSLELIWQVKIDINWKITNMILQDFEVVEPRLISNEK